MINHVRLYKRIILLCELMGFDGRRLIKEGREWEEKSTMMWDVKFDNVMKPWKKIVEKWMKFIQWIQEQEI